MIRRPRSPTLFPYTTLFRSSTETCGPPKRRSESADPQDVRDRWHPVARDDEEHVMPRRCEIRARRHRHLQAGAGEPEGQRRDRKSTRLNSSHSQISYAVFCLNDPTTTEPYTLSLHDALPI